VFLGVTVVVFVLDGGGRVWDREARGVLVMDADNVVGLPFASLKFRVSFTLRLLAWSGVFLAISMNRPREKSVLFVLGKILHVRSERRQENGAQTLNA